MSDGGVGAIVVVCSANQCRSPLTAAMLAEALRRRGMDVPVSSAGTRAFDGSAATDATRRVADRFGLDLTAHRSVPLEATAFRDAGLVLCLERVHVREAVAIDARVWPRTFTLKELVRRGRAIGPRRTNEDVPTWLARVHHGRRPVDLLGASILDDVEDPTSSFSTDHPTLAAEVDRLTQDVVGLLYP